MLVYKLYIEHQSLHKTITPTLTSIIGVAEACIVPVADAATDIVRRRSLVGADAVHVRLRGAGRNVVGIDGGGRAHQQLPGVQQRHIVLVRHVAKHLHAGKIAQAHAVAAAVKVAEHAAEWSTRRRPGPCAPAHHLALQQSNTHEHMNKLPL